MRIYYTTIKFRSAREMTGLLCTLMAIRRLKDNLLTLKDSMVFCSIVAGYSKYSQRFRRYLQSLGLLSRKVHLQTQWFLVQINTEHFTKADKIKAHFNLLDTNFELKLVISRKTS